MSILPKLLKYFIVVRQMVDLPVPAMLFNQNIYLRCSDKAHSLASWFSEGFKLELLVASYGTYSKRMNNQHGEIK